MLLATSLAVVLKRGTTFAPRLAGRDAKVEQFSPPKKGKIAGSVVQLVPVEPGEGGQYFALVEALLACRSANGVGGFDDQQRLVAIHHVYGFQRPVEVGVQLFAPQKHVSRDPLER